MGGPGDDGSYSELGEMATGWKRGWGVRVLHIAGSPDNMDPEEDVALVVQLATTSYSGLAWLWMRCNEVQRG